MRRKLSPLEQQSTFAVVHLITTRPHTIVYIVDCRVYIKSFPSVKNTRFVALIGKRLGSFELCIKFENGPLDILNTVSSSFFEI